MIPWYDESDLGIYLIARVVRNTSKMSMGALVGTGIRPLVQYFQYGKGRLK